MATRTTRTTIISLLFPRSPSAIGWLVWTIVIVALKRCAVWPWSHVCEEGFELTPRRMNPYSPASVVLVRFIGGIKASRDHASPALPLRSLEAAVNRRRFATGAWKTLAGISGSQVAADSYDGSPAGAKVRPHHFLAARSAGPHRGEATKGFASQVSIMHGDIVYTTGG